jgi:flagellar basal-body rod protein FlgG
MIYGILHSALGAFIEGIRLNVVANNLANINSSGYRRDIITFRERLSEAQLRLHQYPNVNILIERLGGAPFIDKISFDKTPGVLKNTGENFDIAIRGDGFFGVKSLLTGKVLYTRSGNFMRSREGKILTEDGKYHLLDRAGEGIVLEPALRGQIRIDEMGNIYLDGNLINTIGIFDFEDYSKLKKLGDNLFEDLSGNPKLIAGKLFQGMLEGSNVDPLRELTRMIEIVRLFEMNLQMLSLRDGILQRVINDLPRIQA